MESTTMEIGKRKRGFKSLVVSSKPSARQGGIFLTPTNPTSVRMSLRKTSCSSCVAAKRRCDQALPACRRCSRQFLACQYPYPPADTVGHALMLDCSLQGLSFYQSSTSMCALEATTYGNTQQSDDCVQDNDLLVPARTDTENFSGDWLGEIPDLSNFLYDDSLDSQRLYTAEQRTVPSTWQRRSKKQKTRLRRVSQQHVAQALSWGSHSPMNFLSKAVLGPWVRFEDEATWRYCANEMLSYISLYATSGTSPITGSMSGESSAFSPVLGRALGICAAHGTLFGTQGRVFNQLIDRELEDLVAASQSAPVHDGRWERHYFEAVIMDTTARMQALTMYQIIRLFSDKARDLQKAAAHEALFASWARELQLQVQILQQSAPSRGSAAVIGPAVDAADPKVIDAAYRAILISYAVRAVHSVLNDKTCAVWDDLFTIVMPASLSGQARLLYPEYVIQWEMKSTPTLYEDDRRLSNLVVAACKGVDVVQQANS